MLILTISLFLLATAMGVYIYALNAELKRMSEHIRQIAETDTNGEIYTLTCSKPFRRLARQINAMLWEQRQRQIQLKRVDAAFKESVAGLSHDLRTPLTSVSGYLQMVQTPGVPPEKTAKYFQTINRRLEALIVLLDELFEYTKIELNQTVSSPEALSLTEVFLAQLTMYFDEFQRRGMEPALTLPDEPVAAFYDKRSLERIFQNLIKNALTHGNGNFSVVIEKRGALAFIEVANSARLEGLDVNRLFDRFYTSDKSRSGGGTGLGLAIVRQLAEHMGGTVRATADGEMLRIQITLPLA